MWKKLTILLGVVLSSLPLEAIEFLDEPWEKQKTAPFIYAISDFYQPKENLNLQLTLIIEKDLENPSLEEIIKIAEDEGWSNSGIRETLDGHIILLSQFDYKIGKVLIGFTNSKDNIRTTYWIKKENNKLYAKNNITTWINKYLTIIITELPKLKIEIKGKGEIITLTGNAYDKALNDPIRIAIFSDLKSSSKPQKELPSLLIGAITSITLIIITIVITIIIKKKRISQSIKK
jgi:hypothetical protein